MNNQNSHYSVIIKTPYKFMWSFGSITIIFGNSFAWGLADGLTDLMFGIAFLLIVLMNIYTFYLLYKFYSKKSVKKISVNTAGTTIITYQIFRSDMHGGRTRDFVYYNANLKIKTEKNKILLLDKGKPIAKIYKDSLLNKKDWEWLIDYYKSVNLKAEESL